jgi:hypothetical protein
MSSLKDICETLNFNIEDLDKNKSQLEKELEDELEQNKDELSKEEFESMLREMDDTKETSIIDDILKDNSSNNLDANTLDNTDFSKAIKLLNMNQTDVNSLNKIKHLCGDSFNIDEINNIYNDIQSDQIDQNDQINNNICNYDPDKYYCILNSYMKANYILVDNSKIYKMVDKLTDYNIVHDVDTLKFKDYIKYFSFNRVYYQNLNMDDPEDEENYQEYKYYNRLKSKTGFISKVNSNYIIVYSHGNKYPISRSNLIFKKVK